MCLKTRDSENSQNKWSRAVEHMKENGTEFLYNANLIRASVPTATEANGWKEDIMLLFIFGIKSFFEGSWHALIHNVALGLASSK